ncbi:phosphoribosylformylglycinamidine synthase subunit PurQ [Roseibacillus ishigakijimensis]|uniref:Phosphoribosylformylglycinamidine synthase subunit PurQ n=1 Tax=Roseibacillus ishigakijimensis TaxID=454146 RepID=A0A934VIL2_9BACT|nr:phosphoribosylformylglycinamidine synthase subunit PurQ [Roseibacillus ishigakijimensis]MBK1835188.1 phosphoribosylformylglycinamidine synthase subunit PurQ [Roseibacillus ishigakijimensis]
MPTALRVHALYVEKRPEHSQPAQSLLADLRETLDLPQLRDLRRLQRYFVDGLSEEHFAQASELILSEPFTEVTYRELPEASHRFAIEFLPGQFDQRADSAAQCIAILTGEEAPPVSSAQVYLLEGDLSADDLARIKDYLINPVDSHEASLEIPETLTPPVKEPADVAILEGFLAKNESELSALRDELGLAMTLADLIHTQGYFRDEEKRDPSLTEIKLLDTYWSDHCRHTTFLTKIDEVTFDDDTAVIQESYRQYQKTREALYGVDTERPETLMDLAIIAAKELKKSGELDNLEISEEINAASIIVEVPVEKDGTVTNEEYLIQFKNETHNHPTEIEPFGGAATCLGGCIRDPLSGRAYVYQAMRVTGAWDPRTPFSETLPNKLPQRKICLEAARGYSSYGNQIGLATGQVSEIYHPGYLAKRMEIGAVVAACPRSQVQRGTPEPGDIILLIGGRTGRDGVGGATGSSKEHTDTALENSAEVQKGNPPTERKVQRLFRNPELSSKIKRCNDFGAGGVSVAIGELADSLDIDLDAVPKKYQGLDGTELAISESQERMAVVVDPADVAYFIAESDKENLECVQVAQVTDSGRLNMTWRGQTIVSLTRAFIDTNGVQGSAKIHVNKPHLTPALSFNHEKRENLLERCSSDSFRECIGSIGETIAAVLRRVHRASERAGVKPPESRSERLELDRALRSLEERELRSLSDQFLSQESFDAEWEAAGKLGGAEQQVYPERDGTHFVKANNGSYHGSWLQYLERLHLHRLLFPETAYELLGLLEDDFSLACVVKQITARTQRSQSGVPLGASRSQVEATMKSRFGAFRFRNDDYYIPSMDVFVEDLHDENVLLAEDGRTLLFIDPVLFYRPADIPVPQPAPSALASHLASLNLASQKGLGEMFDSSIGAGTVLSPFGGKNQLTPPDAMVAKVPVLAGETEACTHMSWAFDPELSSASPFHGSVHAVAESVCKLVATGARLRDTRLTFQEYFPKLGDDPARWGLPFAALLGAYHAQHGLRLAAIGGKDSMSGSFKDLDVPPTLVSFALAPGSARLAVSPEFKESDSQLSLASAPTDEEGLPDYPALIALADQIHQLVEAGKVRALKYVGQPGLGHALAICALGNDRGAEVTSDLAPLSRAPYTFLLELAAGVELPDGFTVIGKTTAQAELVLNGERHSLDDLRAAYTGTLESVYPTVAKSASEPAAREFTVAAVENPAARQSTPRSQSARPRVLIPVFPGTNCEYDSARAFDQAGAASEIFVFRNLTPKAIEESLQAFAEKIRSSEILFLPGGFSSGDEPDGSAKFIATILRNPRIADAVADLHQERQGLILGICNGFQALVKSGLLPGGDGEVSATLTHNPIARHLSTYVTTRIANTNSPWLANCQVGDLHHIAMSHGEGRFLADEATLEALVKNGQIATQYCDATGEPTMAEPCNPNQSALAIEGITSPCGRILGKMGHTERRGAYVAKNIPGEKHQPLFKAGVAYFR